MSDVITVENLSVSYGNINALSGINLNVKKGEYLGIIGPNGGGKTTLLTAILGLCRKDSGKVFIEGGTSSIGYVPQNAMLSRSFPITALETVMTAFLKKGLHPFYKPGQKDKEFALLCLSKVGLEGFENRSIDALSGGEFQRLLIARALASRPEILMLDEPTASVDPLSREKIYALLETLNKEGMTIVMVTHDLFAVSSSVEKIACLNKTLVYHGESQLTQEVCNAMYGCQVDLIAHGTAHRVLSHHEGGCPHCD